MHRPSQFELFKNLRFYKVHHRRVDRQICDSSFCVGNSLSLMAVLQTTQKIGLDRYVWATFFIDIREVDSDVYTALMLGGA